MAVDLNRGSSNVQLPVEVSQEIWANTVEASAVMSLARRINLPGTGVKVQTITGDATADWVDETGEKPVSRATLGAKTITPYKLAVIEPFSNEFRRDLPGLYAELARRLPSALAKKFDSTIFTGTAPGSGFDVLSGVSTQAIKNGTGADKTTYQGLVKADNTVTTAGGLISGYALAPQARQYLLAATDTTGRPLFIPDASNGGRNLTLLGAPTQTVKAVYSSGTPNQIGIAGDWSEAMYGTVAGVQVAISDTASITDGTTTVTASDEETTVDVPNVLNLWQRNMFAIRAEIEVGFVVRNTNYFVALTDAAVS